ncbi:MAG: hypothetical protein ACYDAY_00810 [Candidatus Dormibacteria bacterium]
MTAERQPREPRAQLTVVAHYTFDQGSIDRVRASLEEEPPEAALPARPGLVPLPLAPAASREPDRVVLDGAGRLRLNHPDGEMLPALAVLRMLDGGFVEATSEGKPILEGLRRELGVVRVLAYRPGEAALVEVGGEPAWIRADGEMIPIQGGTGAALRTALADGFRPMALPRTMSRAEVARLVLGAPG